MQTTYFHDWIGAHLSLVRILLILILFSAMAQFASFGLIQAHVIAAYGAQPEDISFALQIAYAGIISTLPIQFRLLKYFNTRSYLLSALLAGILLNIGCLLVQDLVLFSILRFFVGVTTCVIAGCMLIVLFTTLPESKRMLVGVSLFFSLILSSGLIVGVGASWVVMRANWTVLYYGLIGLQAVAIFLCLLVFKAKPGRRPYPLYQIDWFGGALLMFTAVALAYVFVYGPNRYWFSDPSIRYAAIFATVMGILFLLRQATLKRPLIDLRVFRYGKFIMAILLMIVFYGIKDSINLIYGYSTSFLGWSAEDVVQAGMFNILSVIAATLIVVKAIQVKKENLPLLLLSGFGVMCFYHVWFYFQVTPDLSFAQVCVPIFLQGFACGLLFVPITVFCMATVPASTGMTAIVVCAYARFIATLNSTAGFYTLRQNYNQQFKEGFLSQLIPGNDILTQRLNLFNQVFQEKGFTPEEIPGLTSAMIAKSAGAQSQLLTMRAIFYFAAVLVIIVFLVLLLQAVKTKIAQRSSTHLS